jgi:hypothetical protein
MTKTEIFNELETVADVLGEQMDCVRCMVMRLRYLDLNDQEERRLCAILDRAKGKIAALH